MKEIATEIGDEVLNLLAKIKKYPTVLTAENKAEFIVDCRNIKAMLITLETSEFKPNESEIDAFSLRFGEKFVSVIQ
jgi:hypothetical protein